MSKQLCLFPSKKAISKVIAVVLVTLISVAAMAGGIYYSAMIYVQSRPKPTPSPTMMFSPTPTSAQIQTATPTLTSPTSTPTNWKVVDLIKAVLEDLVEETISGDGLEEIDITLKSKSTDPLKVTIELGTMFQAQSANVQNMVMIEEKIIYLESPEDVISDVIDVCCAAMELTVPQGNDKFTVSNTPSQTDLMKLLNLSSFAKETFRVKQFAVWTITDNPPRNGYVGLGYYGFGSGPRDEEMSTIKALFQNAGVQSSKYQALDLVVPATPSPTPTATPTPTPWPKLLIVSSSNYTEDGYYHIVGEVKNILSDPIFLVTIIATFYNSANEVIGTYSTSAGLPYIRPNQKSPFDLSYPDKVTPTGYKLEVGYQKMTLRQPFEGLTIINHSPSATSTDYKIVGSVKNNGAAQATSVQVVCTFYDDSGTVIGMERTYTDPSTISASGTASFELHSWRALIPTRYELQVEGNT
jgi:hypothetical protein